MLEQLKEALFPEKKSRAKSDTLDLEFKKNETMMIGAEVELQIIDNNSLELTDLSDDLIKRLQPQSKQFVPEWFKSLIEINSTPHKSANDLSKEFESLIKLALQEATAMNCHLMGSGCHPSTHYGDLEMRDHARYGLMLERNQWLARRWMVSGLHIHIGMPSATSCIRYMHFFEHFIPHFVALSASSPYWQRTDTGLDSCRSIVSESLSTAALMYTINSWPEMKELVKKLVRSKTITSLKDLHWDIRPSPVFGTLELRVCDMPTNIADIGAIVAFAHTLALWFSNNADWLSHMPKPPMWLARENKWRALRYGMDAEIITSDSGKTESLREDFSKIMDRIESTALAHNYGHHMEHLKTIIKNGNSSSRQKAVFANTGSFKDVIRHNIQELKQGTPVFPVATPQEQNVSAA